MKRKKISVITEKGELCASVKRKRTPQSSNPDIGAEVPLGRIQYGLPSRRYRHGSGSRTR